MLHPPSGEALPAVAGGHQAWPLAGARTQPRFPPSRRLLQREENQAMRRTWLRPKGMRLHSARTTAPSPAPAPPHLKCPQSTLRFQLSPGPILWQSPAQGQGRPGPGEMPGRKRNKHEGDKEGQALQPSQLGTARAAASSRRSHCWGDMHRSRHWALRPARGAKALNTGTEGTLPSTLRPGSASLSDP